MQGKGLTSPHADTGDQDQLVSGGVLRFRASRVVVISRRWIAGGMISDVAKTSTPPQLQGLHHLGLSITDIERSVRFYCDILGATLLIADASEPDRRFSGRMAILLLGGNILDLCQHPTNPGEQFDPAHTGLDHLALQVDSRASLQD
ncbi:VOC family protein [Mycobacterium sp. 1274761.0]|uniref:VOC family protein n=1 Tax=Mycobacterium sp. 1274761.0 TaxID=1834077 RepID=UPI0007FEB27F|nr:VOC family protein [Mycobacterium sp. 1274761.0]OBK73621.1 hypothetical protein A5651_13545 [Mycobacterium sp. 1274761.0]